MARRDSPEQTRAYHAAYYQKHKEKLLARVKARYELHKEDIKAYSNNWYHTNKAAVKAQRKEYRERNKEALKIGKKRYVLANQEKVAAYARWYRETRGDELRAKKREYRLAHRDEILARYRKKYAADPTPYKLAATMRRCAELRATPPWLTSEQKAQIAEMYKEAKRLQEFDGILRHVDHIWPLRGKTFSGLNVPWNLQILTAKANWSKNNKPPTLCR